MTHRRLATLTAVCAFTVLAALSAPGAALAAKNANAVVVVRSQVLTS